jgi:cysteinyl-tRNA synthetase
MDDDLSTPAAVAVLYDEVREGNTALDADDLVALAKGLARVQAMLQVLGLAADDPVWRRQRSGGEDYRPVVDGLMAAVLAQRDEARSRKDYAAADAVRDTLTSLGITLEDTPRGARWSLSSRTREAH